MPKVSGARKTRPVAKRNRTSRVTRSSTGAMEKLGGMIDAVARRGLELVITYTAVFITGGCLLLALMLFAGGYFFNVGNRIVNLSQDVTKAAGFEIERVTVKGGVQTKTIDILNAIYTQKYGQAVGQSLLHYDIHEAREGVEAIGWVHYASISKLWPNTLHVSISERVPSALWQPAGKGELYLVDDSGAVIVEVGGHQYTDLPMILDAKNPRAADGVLSALMRHPELFKRVSALRHRGHRRWDLVFRNDFLVRLPEKGYSSVVDKVAKLEETKGTLSSGLQVLDLRDEKSVYFTRKSGT